MGGDDYGGGGGDVVGGEVGYFLGEVEAAEHQAGGVVVAGG